MTRYSKWNDTNIAFINDGGIRGTIEIGSITRRRETREGIEESIIDHVMISVDLLNYLTSLVMDEKKNHVLNRISKTKKGLENPRK